MPVEKRPVARFWSSFGFKNTCFGVLKLDLGLQMSSAWSISTAHALLENQLPVLDYQNLEAMRA
jgi:hypothetical protein